MASADAAATASFARGLRRAAFSQSCRSADEGPSAGGKGRAVEWLKVLAGDPVEINPSAGDGFRVMSVKEWAARWRRNGDSAAFEGEGDEGDKGAQSAAKPLGRCLACGSDDTKEHAFYQTWCRGRKHWESESLCLACHAFSRHAYRDPDFEAPEQAEKRLWTAMTAATATGAGATAPAPAAAAKAEA